MKSKILKDLNRDWSLPTLKKTSAGLVIEILKRIDKMKLPSPKTLKVD